MSANAYRRDGGLSGLATGFTDLDHRMGGLQPSDLIIIAGRPAMGKTAPATHIDYHVANTHRHGSRARQTSRITWPRPIGRAATPRTRLTAQWWASSRWKFRPSNSPPASSPS